MTGQESRIVPPEEAREAERGEIAATLGHYRALAHTAAVLGEQRAAVLDLHRGCRYEGREGVWCLSCDHEPHPCPTRRTYEAEPFDRSC